MSDIVDHLTASIHPIRLDPDDNEASVARWFVEAAIDEIQSLRQQLTDTQRKLEAALSTEAQPEVTGAVAWQFRMRPDYQETWGKWDECSKEAYEGYKKAPYVSGWFWESRALYPSSAIEAAVREKLEEVEKIADHEYRAGIIEKDKSWAECSEYIRDAIRAIMESPQPSLEEPAN